MRRLTICSLALLCAACSGPPTPTATPSPTVIARVGATSISSTLFDLRLRSALASIAAGGGPTNNPTMVGNVRASVLRSLLIDTVIAQEAAAAGVAATDAEVQAEIDAQATAAGGMGQLQTKVASLGGSIDQLRDAARSSINEQHLEDSFAHQRAVEVEQALAAGQDFAALAVKYSDDADTASKGGVLPATPRTSVAADDPAYARAVLALTVGGHTDPPVRDAAGYEIVRLDSVTTGTLMLRHIIVNAPNPYTVRERPQWFSLGLFEALATDCANHQIAIYIGNVGDDPCAAASASASPGAEVSPAPPTATTSPASAATPNP